MYASTVQQLAALAATSMIFGVDSLPLPSLLRREGVSSIGGVWQIYEAVKDYLQDANAYDASIPDKCILSTETTSGANCITTVTCVGQDPRTLPDWSVCYLGGEQNFDDPDLGHFTITMTRAGGVDGDDRDGLHNPIFKFDGINSGEAFDVQAILDDQGDKDSGNLCRSTAVSGTERLTWECGIPILTRDAQSLFGMTNIPDDANQDGFAPGWCTARAIQYQRNEFGNGDKFSFAAQIFDAGGVQIGSIDKTPVADDGSLDVTSKLPNPLTIKAGPLDDDPVTFCYGDVCWACDDNDGGDHYCTLGNGPEKGYENGDREGEMGFTC